MSVDPSRSSGVRKTLRRRDILRGYREYSRVMTEGKSLAGEFLRCFISRSAAGQSPSTPAVRVGFTVSRAVRRPVVRNRLKRVMREVYRLHKREFERLAADRSLSLNIVFVFRASGDINPRRIPIKLIENDMQRIMNRAQGAADGLQDS